MKKFFILILFSSIKYYSALPTGAPESVCNSLRPNHGFEPQDSESPYQLIASKLSASGGETIGIEIQSGEQNFFKGFFLLALTNEENPKVIGEFLKDDDEETDFNFRDCRNGSHNSVTHFDNSMKQKISFKWRSPDDFEGSVHFHAIVVQEKAIFWLNHTSADIAITPSNEPPYDIYEDCGKSKSCIGLPSNCLQGKNCQLFGAVIVKNGTYSFEMKSPIRAGYIALALSYDSKMGSDSAIECVNDNGRVRAFTSLTRAIPQNFGARRNDIDQNIITLKTSGFVDGSIYCLVERDSMTEIDHLTFDLEKVAYYLLISSGSTVGPLSIGYHDISRASSAVPTLFTENEPIEIIPSNDQASKTLVLIHGSFMIVAWIGATAIGTFSARFVKKLWIGKKMFGKDIWFIIHQVSMSLTWILTITAVIIIWIDVGEWNTSPHSVLGIIATSLCFIQPLTAFFRPKPDDDARPIFNFMHGSVGKLAHMLAVITIFIATSMARADLPVYAKYVLISYIVVYLIFYAALTNMGIISEIKTIPQSVTNGSVKSGDSRVKQLLTVRRFLMILFSIIIMGFVITLVVAVTYK